MKLPGICFCLCLLFCLDSRGIECASPDMKVDKDLIQEVKRRFSEEDGHHLIRDYFLTYSNPKDPREKLVYSEKMTVPESLREEWGTAPLSVIIPIQAQLHYISLENGTVSEFIPVTTTAFVDCISWPTQKGFIYRSIEEARLLNHCYVLDDRSQVDCTNHYGSL